MLQSLNKATLNAVQLSPRGSEIHMGTVKVLEAPAICDADLP